MKLNKYTIIGAISLIALTLYAATFDIYSTFLPGSSPQCGVNCNATAVYAKGSGTNWGWRFDSSGSHIASVPTNAIIVAVDRAGHQVCGTNSVDCAPLTFGTNTYGIRFSIHWPTANGTAPAGLYPLTLNGFQP